MDKCKENVFHNMHLYRCSRNAIKDGYCKQHHPDEVKKREKKSQELYEEKRKQSCWYKLKECSEALDAAQERERALVKELETDRMRLAACGVVAMANTPESATLSRIPKDSPYWSASLGDVENAVDREMALIERERVLRDILSEMVQAFVDYEMEVDVEPPHKHIKMMQKARAALERKEW